MLLQFKKAHCFPHGLPNFGTPPSRFLNSRFLIIQRCFHVCFFNGAKIKDLISHLFIDYHKAFHMRLPFAFWNWNNFDNPYVFVRVANIWINSCLVLIFFIFWDSYVSLTTNKFNICNSFIFAYKFSFQSSVQKVLWKTIACWAQIRKTRDIQHENQMCILQCKSAIWATTIENKNYQIEVPKSKAITNNILFVSIGFIFWGVTWKQNKWGQHGKFSFLVPQRHCPNSS